jgi:hypothetical protein
MANLAEILKAEVAAYAGNGQGANVRLFAVLDDDQQVYTVNTVRYPERTRPANVMVMARILGEQVVIEEDRTDRPLLEALLQAGLKREQIILAYAGEATPEVFA